MKSTPDYERTKSGASSVVSRIGGGTLGGKANGLLFIERVLRNRYGPGTGAKIPVGIPRMSVIGADFFVEFMEQNDLYDIAASNLPDDRIAHAFQKAQLPPKLVGDLRDLAEQAHAPLAIRSSSLLEDALYRPFAGVYATKMVPNNQPSADERFKKLREAIKFVYASTYFRSAKDYVRTFNEDPGGEKMAVIIQEIFGARHDVRFYPDISGVARSHNFYPVGSAKPEDGVVSLALGLGKTVVDGGRVWSYSPAYPKSPPPYNSLNDMLKNTQTEFWAVNMGKPPAYDPIKETEYLVQATLRDAEYDNTHRFVASTYVARSDRIVPGVGQDGPRLINFGPILELNDIPLNDLIKDILTACEEAVGTEVEIEFAVKLHGGEDPPAEFGFLQVRPMVVEASSADLPLERLDGPDVLVAAESALGVNQIGLIQDIVYVLPGGFDTKTTERIALELEKINASLVEERRPYLLIGFGRWGTSDPWRGIPVSWSQISGARAIVEVELPGMETDLSQGSHFFHNMTGFKVSYFCVRIGSRYQVDWDWLKAQREAQRTLYVRHVRTVSPVSVLVDGKTGRGLITR